MDEEFTDSFLGFSRPRELGATDIVRPSAPSTGGRGTARPRPANAAAAASGRREGLGDAMMDGIARNDERREISRRDRDVDTLIASHQELLSNVKQLTSLITDKKGASVSARKASLFPGVDTEGFMRLLAAVRGAGPVRSGGGNASLHFRRLLVKFCHTKSTWSYNPLMRKRLANIYFKVLQSCHGDELTRLKVDTLTAEQLKMFIAKFLSSVVDHNICQWRSHIKGKIKESLGFAFGVPRSRCVPVDEDDPYSFDLMARNTKLNHRNLSFVMTDLFGEKLGVLGNQDNNCDDLISFLFQVWNELRNWSSYGANAPSVDDIAWMLDVAEDAFTDLQSDDHKKRCVFFHLCHFHSDLNFFEQVGQEEGERPRFRCPRKKAR